MTEKPTLSMKKLTILKGEFCMAEKKTESLFLNRLDGFVGNYVKNQIINVIMEKYL